MAFKSEFGFGESDGLFLATLLGTTNSDSTLFLQVSEALSFVNG